MSKPKSKEEIEAHKTESINNLSSFIDTLISSEDSKDLKRADLISYWLKDFQLYLSQEKNFDASKIKSYKRGDVIKVNLGFNIGSEQGGLRYAIVLDRDNKHNSKTVTIIPLTSQKEEKKIYERDLSLGTELYNRLKAKHDSMAEKLKKETDECTKNISQSQEMLNLVAEAFPDEKYSSETEIFKFKSNLKEVISKQNDVLKELQEDSKALNKISIELHRMKDGSIAKMEQITTISKQRIFDPRKKADVLSGISFSDAAMEKINDKLKELYIFS